LGIYSAQVAEQASVGAAFVPVKLAWKPKLVLPAAAMAPLKEALVAVTAVPLEVTVAFQLLVMAWLPPQVQVAFQVLMATVPELVMVTVVVKPFAHWLSTCSAAVHFAPPELDAVAVGVAVREAEDEAVAVGVAVREAEEEAVAVGVAVRVGVGVAVREAELEVVGVVPEMGDLIDAR
jgi:hypothetical protein